MREKKGKKGSIEETPEEYKQKMEKAGYVWDGFCWRKTAKE